MRISRLCITGTFLVAFLRASVGESDEFSDLKKEMDALQDLVIRETVRRHDGNLAAAARSLGLTERVLRLRAKRHGLRPGDYRMPARA